MNLPMNLPKYRCHVGATKIIEATRRKDGSMDLVTDAGEFRTAPGYFDRCYRGTEEDRGYFLRDDDGYETWVSAGSFAVDFAPLQELEDNRTAKALEKVMAKDEPASEPAETEKPIQPKRRVRKKKSEATGQPSDN